MKVAYDLSRGRIRDRVTTASTVSTTGRRRVRAPSSNRLTRHNIRDRTQVLTGHASRLVDGAVTATVDRESVNLAVSDRGPGTPETERAVSTGDREISQLEHGSGLGLWVAERYGGDLYVENDGGATVTLPLRAARLATAPDGSAIGPGYCGV